ncbi:MAG: sugar-binding protein [Candidatus Bathycorpusculaceae bacterium]
MRFTSVMAHSGIVLSAWTWRGPSIDGAIGEEEWSAAAKVDFNIVNASAPDGTYNGTMYVMNDHDNLYLAVKITDDDFGNDGSTFDVLFFLFDNDNSGFPLCRETTDCFAGALADHLLMRFFTTILLDGQVILNMEGHQMEKVRSQETAITIILNLCIR